VPNDLSPTARALRALEILQARPGVTAGQLAERLGVTERAARRYVGILREAGIQVESARGPHGGYRLRRGTRLPPIVFTQAEALGLVMAVLDGQPAATEADDPVAALEENLGTGWEFPTRVVFHARPDQVAPWIRPPMGQLRPWEDGCVLVGSTGNPVMYAQEWLAAMPFDFHVEGGDELRAAVAAVAARFAAALPRKGA
jgi:biotin operon repressor